MNNQQINMDLIQKQLIEEYKMNQVTTTKTQQPTSSFFVPECAEAIANMIFNDAIYTKFEFGIKRC